MKDTNSLKSIAELARSQTYIGIIRPFLEEIKIKSELVRVEPQNEFEAVKQSFQRLERIKTIDKIMEFIEKAEDKLNNEYK